MTASRSLRQLMDLDGRVALITGGAGHIGREAAAGLAELGARVVLADRDGPALTAAAQAIPRALPLAVDLANEPETRALASTAVERCGRLDILIHAAGFVGTSDLAGWVTPFAEQTSATWRAALEVNLTSFFELAQSAAPALKASGHGSVIAVSSIYGLLGPDLRLYEGTAMGNPAAYAASKGGLLQMTRWLATVLAPEIRVNAVTPGGVARQQPEAFAARYVERTPLGRMAREEDLKGAIAYLASDLSAYVTGHNLVVDGGWTAW